MVDGQEYKTGRIQQEGGGMKLRLPMVSLVAVETRENALMRLAIKDCVDKVEFAEVLILTNEPDAYRDLGCKPRFHVVPDWPDKLGWCRGRWYEPVPHLRTGHVLNCEWDGCVWDTSMWRDNFLKYDYVGAVWHHLPPSGKRVGNEGFSLMSTRLRRYLADRRDRFPCDSDVDDSLICIKYRPALEDAGFLFAPENVADEFAFEGCDGRNPTRHFGAHAAFNMPYYLSREKLVERVRLMLESPGLRENYMIKNLCQKHRDLMKEILGEICREEGQDTKPELPASNDTIPESRVVSGISLIGS